MDKLEAMLKYVSEHNDFYKKRIAEYGISNPLDITQWPILTRRELQENRYQMFSDGYKLKYYNQQLRRQSSSGSTGMPVVIYWDYNDWYASNLCLWRKRKNWYGIKPKDKYCIFTLDVSEALPVNRKLHYINKPRNLLSFNISLIRDDCGYEQMANVINEFKPDWLFVQPFVLNQLTRAYKRLGIRPTESIRYIESFGEVLTSDLKRRVEEFFRVKVANMYGSEEMNGIALENLDGKLFVFDDNTYLEIHKENGISKEGKGESIITSLNNFAMPLIRYNQGDILNVYNNTIGHIEGRHYSEIVSCGKSINSFSVSEIISSANNILDDIILEFCCKFKRRNYTLEFIIVIDPKYTSWQGRVKEVVFKIADERLSDMNIHIMVNFDNLVSIQTKKKEIFAIED